MIGRRTERRELKVGHLSHALLHGPYGDIAVADSGHDRLQPRVFLGARSTEHAADREANSEDERSAGPDTHRV